jgi:flagellin
MALNINTNIGALGSAAAASSVNKSMELAMERLSTGLRINTAADDAAGVAIASRLTSEIRGTNQAIRNAMDGQAMIDTAEGAHNEITNILQRMREVIVQAANDTNNASDRANLQTELDNLTAEIDRIAGTTAWAGKLLLDGSTPDSKNLSGVHSDKATFNLQVGSSTAALDTMAVQIGAVSSKALGISGPTTTPSTQLNVAAAATKGNLEITAQTDNSSTFTLSGVWNSGDIYTASIAGVQVQITAADADGYSNDMEGLARQFADKASEVILLPANDAALSNMTVSRVGTAVTVSLGQAGGQFTLNNTAVAGDTNSDGTITVANGNQITIANTTYDGAGESFSVDINGTTISIAETTDYGAGTAFAASDAGAAAALAAKVNGTAAFSAAGISATSNAGVVTLKQVLVPSGVTVTSGAAASTISESSGTFTVGGTVTAGDKFTLTIDGTKVETTIAAGDQFTDDIAGAVAQIAQAIEDAGLENVKVTNVTGTTFDLEKSNSIQVDTLANARSSLQSVDNAINVVNTQRANLGAVSNRLDSTVANLTNISTNLESGRSRIMDADFAAESTNLAKAQILQQASMAMLAQANASKQSVLQLLQG